MMRKALIKPQFATLIVSTLIILMVGSIAWNEYHTPNLMPVSAIAQVTYTPFAHTLQWGRSQENTDPNADAEAVRLSASTQIPSATPTIVPTETPTPTPMFTPTPTQAWLRVAAEFGVNLRDAPGGNVIRGLPKDTLVLPSPGIEKVEANGFHWVFVSLSDGQQGWLAEENLAPATSSSENEAP